MRHIAFIGFGEAGGILASELAAQHQVVIWDSKLGGGEREAMLAKADYVGVVSGHKTDKSGVFAFEPGETGAPLIAEAPVVMECRMDDVYETKGFESFVCEIVAVHADESVLNADGKIDYRALKPVLFEMPTYEYLRTGDVIAPCTTLGKELRTQLAAEAEAAR